VSIRPYVCTGELAGRDVMKLDFAGPYRFQGYLGFHKISNLADVNNYDQTECPNAKKAMENLCYPVWIAPSKLRCYGTQILEPILSN
jgi:hypothetical protein